MSDDTQPQVPAPEAPADPGTSAAPEGKAPQWDGPFDPDRAARLVENLRSDVERLKSQNSELSSKVVEYEQAQMTEAEKVAQRLSQAEQEAAALRRELAIKDALRKYQLSDEDAEWLSGNTPEEIDAKAAKLAERMAARITPESEKLPPTVPVPGYGGDRPPDGQITEDMLESMSPHEIVKARAEGRLDHLLGRK